MKHASTRELFDYWNRRRGTRPAPERGEIEPGAIRQVLADTFILAIDPPAGHPFRIAGTRVCAAFGRELKGVAFTELWEAARQAPVRDTRRVVSLRHQIEEHRQIGGGFEGANAQLLQLPDSQDIAEAPYQER